MYLLCLHLVLRYCYEYPFTPLSPINAVTLRLLKGLVWRSTQLQWNNSRHNRKHARTLYRQETLLIGPQEQFSLTEQCAKSCSKQSVIFSKRLGRITTKSKKIKWAWQVSRKGEELIQSFSILKVASHRGLVTSHRCPGPLGSAQWHHV